MNILAQMYRDSVEHFAGRISAYSAGWVFAPTKALIQKTINKGNRYFFCKPGTEELRTKTAPDGRIATVVMQQTVWCTNPDVGIPDYVQRTDKDGKAIEQWEVPNSVCKKCNHRRKADRRFRYPRCMFKSAENPKQAAAQDVLDSFRSACKTASEMMGGCRNS